jgi:DNA-binding CsgD family transcriptional regulator/tetratricopeptide (TPR) repeat protein
MVGRSAELDRLVDLLDDGRSRSVALVAGEAGIGKTRLIQELLARVPAGVVALAGQADQTTSSKPLALFSDALNGVTGPVGSAKTGMAVADDDPLALVVRDIDQPADARVAAAVELVCRLAADRPGLLVFEDIHWADAESVAVFEQLSDPSASNRLVLVGTYRPDGLSRRHPAADLLPRLERRHSITHISLGRLSQDDVGVLLTSVYGEPPAFRLVSTLHNRTGGNPFFLEELIASSPTMPCYDLEAMPLPWTVSELVRAQVDDLDPAVRRIVASASELGRRVPFDVLSAVTQTSEDQLITLLRAAVDSGLLLEIEPDVFGFHHEIAREAIASGLLGRERRRLHEAALAALRNEGSRDHAALARHAQGAGRYDDMVDEARRGARQSLNHGSTYQALELAELGLSEADDDLDLLSIAARSASLAGLLVDAAEHGDRWLRLAREADDVSAIAAALSVRGRVAFETGDVDAMSTFADALVDVVDRLPTDEERAEAMAALAQSYMLREQLDPTVEWADKAHQLAEAHGLDRVRIAAMVEKGTMLLLDPEQGDEGKALLEAAIDEAERLNDHVLVTRATNNLVWHAVAWYDADVVRKLIEKMQRHAKAAGWLGGSGHVQALAQLAAFEGDIDRAIAHLDEVGVIHADGWKQGRWLWGVRAGFALETGDYEDAARFAAEAKPATSRTSSGMAGLDFHVACRLGRPAEARALLQVLLAAVADEGYASASQVHDMLPAALSVGLTIDELRPLTDQVGLYTDHRLDPSHPWRELIDAQIAEASGAAETAAGLYARAAESLACEPQVSRGHIGTAHVGAARSLIALGRLADARPHVVAAQTDLARWRGWRVDDLRAVERRLGLGPEPTGPAALTPREREVAALLAEGLTNSQLAERLFISPRTAAVHVSNILAKLGMSSRSEIAAFAAAGHLNDP